MNNISEINKEWISALRNGYTHCKLSSSLNFEGTIIQSLIEKVIMYKYNISHILKQLRLDCGESCPRLSTILEKISENIFSAQDGFWGRRHQELHQGLEEEDRGLARLQSPNSFSNNRMVCDNETNQI